MDSEKSKHSCSFDVPPDQQIDRREFLRLSAITALMSSAMLAASPAALGALQEAGRPRTYGALVPLAPGAVSPEGWLRSYLEKQAIQLGSQLPQVSEPFTGAYWAGEEKAESWWPWEQKGYWIDGATRLAIVLGNQKLQRQAQAAIDFTLAHAAPDGYLGPSYFENDRGKDSRWPQSVFFRAMAVSAAARPRSEQDIADAMRKHYINDKTPYGKPIRNVTNIEAMLWCYERTGDSRLLKMAESAWTEYLTVADKSRKGDLSPLRVYADTAIDAHGVTYAEVSKLPAILYLHTGKKKYWKFAQAAQRRIFDHHMLIDGVPSTSEWFHTRTSLDSHETCDMSDHTWSWGYMMMASGDGVWGDRIERACFNAVPGAIKNDWKALQYFSCPNQFLATFDSNHNITGFGDHRMAYQPNPGRHVACCGGNVHRVLPNYVLRMWMQSADGGLTATLYGPSRVTALVGANCVPVEIVQTTNYPFEEQIHLEIRAKQAVRFPLSLRIPVWCAKPRLRLNGKSVDGLAVRNGFVTLDRRFAPGDTVTLEFPMHLAVSDWPENGVGIERGPLVYSLAIRENWQSSVVPRYSTAAFPGWQATPMSAWNYGVDLRRGDLEKQIRVQQKKVTGDPWSDPPIALTVPARKIEDWDLLANPEKPEQKFTPALPEIDRSRVSKTTENITLVPYGSTKLRITIFPSLTGVDDEQERKI